ncbi:MAG: flagellar brake protein [Defluviitaleaceae bacterium]|nr:flagellar brake protein [Defluviitaleaceae bacterium]MCL2264182.1 flagellar brake protein [Defluviitaleaceae bacterium]
MSLLFMEYGTCVEVKGISDPTPYITAVHEVLEDGRVLLDIPRMGDKEKRLPTNKPYFLRFFSPKGIYRFTVVLCGFIRKGSKDYMVFQSADDGEKIVSRQAFRLNCSEKVGFCVIDGGYEGEIETGSIRDISAGGVRLKAFSEMEKMQLMRLDIPMIYPDFSPAGIILSVQNINEAARPSLIEQLRGNNLAKQTENAKEKYLWQYGIAFVGISDEDVERIIMHIHEQQYTM